MNEELYKLLVEYFCLNEVYNNTEVNIETPSVEFRLEQIEETVKEKFADIVDPEIANYLTEYSFKSQ